MEIQRLTESVHARESEIQRLITERDSILQQNGSDEISPEIEEEMSRLRSQIDSLQRGLNEERGRHEQVVEELTGSLQQERIAHEGFKSNLNELREKFESEVEKLKTDVSAKQDQLAVLSTRNDLLNSSIETLRIENENLKQLEADFGNIQDLNLSMESKLKVLVSLLIHANLS